MIAHSSVGVYSRVFRNEHEADDVVNIGIKVIFKQQKKITSSVAQSGVHWFKGLMLNVLS